MDRVFNIFRKERDSRTNNKWGGGVFIVVKKSLKAEPIQLTSEELEQVFVKIKCSNKTSIIGCLYVPPNSPWEIYNKRMKEISNINLRYCNDKIIIIGDYNIPGMANEVKLGVREENCLGIETLTLEKFALQGCVQYNNV